MLLSADGYIVTNAHILNGGVNYGTVRHAYLDLSFRDMDAGQAKRLGAKNANGVLIDSLQAGGAGDQAGLRRDDIILELDRQRIDTPPAATGTAVATHAGRRGKTDDYA